MDIDKKRESIDEKIVRLEMFCTNNQELWFNRNNANEVQRLLNEITDEADRNKKAEEIKKARLDYDYIKARKNNGKLKPEYIEKMKNAKVGGVFEQESNDKEACNRNDISSKAKSVIIENYGSIDNFKRVYIHAMINGSHENIIPKGLEDKLITSFDISDIDLVNRKGAYFTCLNKICDGKINGQKLSDIKFIDSNKIENVINEMIYHTVFPKYARMFKLNYGLNTEKHSIREIAEEYNTSLSNVYSTIRKTNRKISKKIYRNEYYKEFQADNRVSKFKIEEFIKKYFENRSIFYNSEENELDETLRKELLEIYNDGKTILEQIDYIYNHSTNLAEIEFLIKKIEEGSNVDCSRFKNNSREKLEYLMSNIKGIYDKYIQIHKEKEYTEKMADEQKITFIQKNIGETVNIKDFFWDCSRNVIKEGVKKFKKNFGTEEIEISKYKDYYITSEYLNNIIYKYLIEKYMAGSVKDNMKETEESDKLKKDNIAELKDEEEFEQEQKEEQEKADIMELKLSTRAYNALTKNGITYIENLIAIDKEDLMSMRNIGQGTFNEIVSKVHNLGYKFKDEEEFEQEKKEEQEQANIMELKLNTRAYNALTKNGITYIEDLIAIDKEDLMSMRNIGQGVFNEIVSKVHNLGYEFRDKKKHENQQENIEKNLDSVLQDYIQLLEDAYTRLNRTNKKYSELEIKVNKKKNK